MAKPFEGRPGGVADHRKMTAGRPMGHRNKCGSGWVDFPLFPARQYDDGRGRPLNTAAILIGRITERLEGRVKGLTPVFPALLLTTEFPGRGLARGRR